MIINIRGTSGSGKSTVVRKIKDCYFESEPIMVEGRRQPIGYMLSRVWGKRLFLAGHYETACGGCDTITSIDQIYELVRQYHNDETDVLFEGLLISAEVNRTTALHTDGLPLLVVGMNTPLDICLSSINTRRQEAFIAKTAIAEARNEGRKKPRPMPKEKGEVNPRNTESKFKATETTMRRLLEAGVRAEWHDRDSAVQTIKLELGLT